MADNLILILRREMELHNYSPKTVGAYVRVVQNLYQRYRRPLRELSPVVLSRPEIEKMLATVGNPRHYLMISLA